VNGLCGEEGMGKEKQNMGMGYAGEGMREWERENSEL
jgi:hypothetical protein